MSNWLEPACARAAMAIGRPAIETAAAGVEDADATAVCPVVVFVARMAKVGKLAVAAFTVLAAVCAAGAAPFGGGVCRCARMKFVAVVFESPGVLAGGDACWAEAVPGDAA